MPTDTENLYDKATIDSIYNYGVTIFDKLQSLSEQNYRTAVEQKTKAEQLDKSLAEKKEEIAGLRTKYDTDIKELTIAREREIQDINARLAQEQAKVQNLQTQVNIWKTSSQLVEQEANNLKNSLANIYNAIRSNSQQYQSA